MKKYFKNDIVKENNNNEFLLSPLLFYQNIKIISIFLNNAFNILVQNSKNIEYWIKMY